MFRSTAAEHYDFTGRLAFSWPKTAMPVSFGPEGEVAGALFARGWGLSYASTGESARLSEDPAISVLLLEAGESEAGRLRMRMPGGTENGSREKKSSLTLQTKPPTLRKI